MSQRYNIEKIRSVENLFIKKKQTNTKYLFAF
jgi:hypothetical protein